MQSTVESVKRSVTVNASAEKAWRAFTADFGRLRELGLKHNLAKLSMGMSNDFEAAIEEGATHIRVGTALFGPRPKP